MVKALSFECRHPSPLNESEKHDVMRTAWVKYRCLIITKEQQAILSVDLLAAVNLIGGKLYKDYK